MKLRSYMFFMALALFVMPLVAHADSSTQIAAKLGESIKTGRAARPGSDVAFGTALAVVDAPIADVKKVITDYSNYPRFMPHFKKSKVLSARGSRALIYMEASVAKGTMTLWAQLKASAKDRKDGSTEVDVKYVEGNMDNMSAHWVLEPVGDGSKTLVHFRIHVEPSLPLPSSLYSHENEKAARKTLRAIRQRVGKS